eukprot:3823207-Ditylum_brightwellii.AAC.1
MSSDISTVITTIDRNTTNTTNKARERHRIGEILLFSYAVYKNKETFIAGHQDDGSVSLRLMVGNKTTK